MADIARDRTEARDPAPRSATAGAARRELHVVSHTHWDREWYHVASRFRQRLVTLLDELLDEPAASPDDERSTASFLLDGQTVVLDDYLAVRPERRERLARALAARGLEAGPWYVLADELIPSGEALVRNLLAGRRTLRALGAFAPPVLYCPDSFGHPAVLPTLALGFGMGVAVVWRGYGGRRWPGGDVVRWRAPDGGSVVLHHLPPDGYEFASSLPTNASDAEARWTRLRAASVARATTGVSLLLNGADHHARQPTLGSAVDALAAAAIADADARGELPPLVVRSSLAQWADAVSRAASAASLPEIAGELRDSYGYTWTLGGTLASRAHQKRANARVERALTRDAEPWAALAARARDTSRRAVADAAWRTLLLDHPHDTLCGCSTDAVARAADERWRSAAAQARGLREDALLDIVGGDRAPDRARRAEWREVVVVRNAAARERGGVATLRLVRSLARVGVGPGSSDPTDVAAMPALPATVQPLRRTMRFDRVESPLDYPANDLVVEDTVLAWVPPAAGYGTRSFDVSALAGLPPPPDRVVAADNALRNDALRITVADDGTVRLTSASGATIDDLVRLEDATDVGDLYTPAIRGPATRLRFVGARVARDGPLRASLDLHYRSSVPRTCAAGEAERLTGRAPRRRGRRVIRVRVRLSLDAGADHIVVAVQGRNTGADHRLRILLATGAGGVREHAADAAFGPVVRRPIDVPPGDASRETPVPTLPLHRWVSVASDRGGACVASDGLAEYEVLADGRVAVTLVRAVGELSRGGLPERPGHAGWPVATPRAQCLGPFRARLAVRPAQPGDPVDAPDRFADDVLLPLRGETIRSLRSVPGPTSGATLNGAGLVLSALAEAEREGWTVARCVNVSDEAVDGSWRFDGPVTEAWLARLDETPLEELAARGGVVAFLAGPRAVVTVLWR